jgi:hypothetical protein
MRDDQELRFKCLELAVKTTSDANEQLARAKTFVDFVEQKSPQNKPQNEVSQHKPNAGNPRNR